MFKTLGLFGSSACPDKSCTRPRCFFNHGAAVAGPGPSTTAAAARSRERPTPRAQGSSISSTPVAGSSKRAGAVTSSSSSSASMGLSVPTKRGITTDVPDRLDSKRPKSLDEVRKEPMPPVKTSVVVMGKIGSSVSAPVGRSVPQAATKPPVNVGKPPTIPMGKSSPQPLGDRQKALQTLYTQYVKLYSDILASSPTLAHESAIAQEQETSSTSPNLRAYKTAIHHAAVSISRRIKPDSPTHPSVGTVKQSKAATDAAEKEASGRLTSSNIAAYCLPLDDFEKWSYPDPRDESLVIMEPAPTTEGTTQVCDRCKVSFILDSSAVDSRFGECHYHHGRTAPELVEGRRKWIYSCCGKERGSQGCEEGVHVFSDRDDDAKLASRWAYKTTQECAEEARKEGKEVSTWSDIVAIDCEMIYTATGSSLARVSVIDEKGNLLLDDFVRQRAGILDYNSRFSGVSKEDMDKAVLDLPAARAAVCTFVGPNTIIVGHGLENDLRALRLLHDKVVDTAIVFPHDRGPPFRRSLRDLVKENLGYFIQDRTADLGHSSLEDAKATLELLRYKVREDKEGADS